ncbi:MAG: TonB-dependent receptor [Saprospiraceae bacterium]
MLKNTLLLLLTFVSLSLQAQQKYTISGKVKDNASGEELIGASVRILELPNAGRASNEYGFFSITLPEGIYTVNSSYAGYQDFNQKIKLDKDTKIDILLSQGIEIQEIIVSATRKNDNVTRAQMGVEKIEMKDVRSIPVLFGERDILKTIQLLPGVKSAGEGNSGFYVRGGSADQNLILLDEAPVYNASHLLGFFSTFNSDAIKDATLYKGNAPAQYGGRLASVLDLKMNEGNDKTYHVTGGLGLISSRLSVEGPIQKEKSSFLIAGRRTYADMFLKLSDQFKDNSLYFYDLNAKMNYHIGEKDRIFVSGYLGRDVLGLGDQFGLDWGNKTATVRWNHLINNKLFSNTSVIYSDYNYEIQISGGGNQFNISSEIKDWNFKQEFQWFPNTRNNWRFGVNSIYHTIIPSRFTSSNSEVATTQQKDTRYGWENAIYANNSFKLNSKINIDYGLRLSAYSIIGSGTFNVYDKNIIKETKELGSGEIGKTYLNLEPRVSSSYTIDEKSSLKAAYSRNTQHLHLLSNSTSSSPTDQWVGNSFNIKPEIADQISVGYFRNFFDNKFEFSFETYYKYMQNQVDFRNGADINTAPDVESELLYGKGRAYGAEFFIKKKTGKLTGWVSYTLARTERKIEGISDNNWYKAKQDRLHDLSIVGMYQLTPKWNLSANWVYYTGNAITFPSGKYGIGGNTVYVYTERNGYRMPAYHRLDVGATYESKRKGRYQGSWNFSVYNAYARENAYTITFEDNPDDPSKTQAVQTALFKMIPSVTYNFKW